MAVELVEMMVLEPVTGLRLAEKRMEVAHAEDRQMKQDRVGENIREIELGLERLHLGAPF